MKLHRWGMTMLGGGLLLLGPASPLLRADGPFPEERPPEGQRNRKIEEYEARAAFLLSLAKFTEWPEEALPPGEPLVLGVLGESPMGGALEALASTQVQGRKIVVRRFRTASEVQPCHMLYFPTAEERQLQALAPRLAGHGVFTVGETSFFLGFGGALQLFTEEGRMRFVLNRAALDQSHLRVSAQVQRLAKQILP
jgi:hypothetical protein